LKETDLIKSASTSISMVQLQLLLNDNRNRCLFVSKNNNRGHLTHASSDDDSKVERLAF
jgi:hypothetical protein